MENNSDIDEGIQAANTNSRRPMNAFLLFCKRHRGIVKDKYPNLENRNITKILGEWWQSLGDEEKAVFNNLASEYKDHVMKETNFRWRKPPPNNIPNTHFTKSQKSLSIDHSPKSLANDDTGQTSEKATNTNGRSAPISSNIKSSSPEAHAQLPPLSATATSNSTSSSAPKHFKKRFLQQAKLDGSNTSSSASSSTSTSEQAQAPVSPEAEHACKALLQLAGVRESSPPESRSHSNQGSRSGTSSPPGEGAGGGRGNKAQGFDSLRDAVWNRVARDLLRLEEEKGNGKPEAEDAPLNLSSQCTIRGQTIIEHIIENILDLPKGDSEASSERSSVNLNNNSSAVNGETNNGQMDPISEETAEQIKERIYQGLKQDILKRAPGVKDDKDRSALWKVLPHNNISNPKSASGNKKPSQTLLPEVTAAPSSNQVKKELPKAADKPEPRPEKEEERVVKDDGTKLDIKNLLAQSPVPLSPRSKTTCPSTASLTNAVIAEVLQQQQPVNLFLPPTHQRVQQPPPPVSVTLVTTEQKPEAVGPLNLSTTPPQTPSPAASSCAVTITATTATVSPTKRKILPVEEEEEEEDIRRSSRSCKGRRYQEFKDEGRLGKRSSSGGRKGHRSGDSSEGTAAREDKNGTDHAEDLQSRPMQTKTPAAQAGSTPFDVSARLNAIPALSLDAYQQRILRAKQASGSSSTSSSSSSSISQNRRRSSDHVTSEGGHPASTNLNANKRKTRRSGAASSGVSPTKKHESDASGNGILLSSTLS
jgi:hypothetical protein